MAATNDDDGANAGLTGDEAARRLREGGPNELPLARAGALAILTRQFANPFLLLLLGTALLSLILRDRSDAAIILAIVGLSVALSFSNDYRSARAVEDLRARVRRRAVVTRDGVRREIDVRELVPGDRIALAAGDVVPADARVVEATHFACDEASLTGESLPNEKEVQASIHLGTVVASGMASAVVTATGRATQFGGIARELAHPPPETAFERGLHDFSLLLVRVTTVLAAAIFALNALLRHSTLESFLFALAIAIGLTPQLLPAIVTVSLSAGARSLAKRGVIVKRLVSIEDLGNVEVLFTDKTGTLTEGAIRFHDALSLDASSASEVCALALLCNDAIVRDGSVVSGNALDTALWSAASPSTREGARAYRVLARLPFAYDAQISAVRVLAPDGRTLLVAKGSPEAIFARCGAVGPAETSARDRALADGARVLALAIAPSADGKPLALDEIRNLTPAALLRFSDEPKSDAAASIARLDALGIAIKIVTGDSPVTARTICERIGIDVREVLTGTALDTMDDAALRAALERTTIFARVTPAQKARIIRAQREAGCDVGFLGDGVNDASGLHEADVGISVDSAVDVAKDAADIVLMEKDLGVLADGVIEGRRIFTNTIKYVLMGTSSNFGNMFSAAGASLFLRFLPMLPSQILLNNLLYDASEMAIPTDRVDTEQLQRPARWSAPFIRRFMLIFGPISSLFDFATFGVMLAYFHAHAPLFRSGWFVESLATQSLAIFVIRTRRVPFLRSRPSAALTVATLAIVALGAAIPYVPFARALGFAPLPLAFFAILAGTIAAYLALLEAAKAWFYRSSSVRNAALSYEDGTHHDS